MNNILREIPDSFDSPRLTLRSPQPAMARSSMPRSTIHCGITALDAVGATMPSLDESEVYAREAAVRYFKREELPLLLFLKGTNTLVGSSGLHRNNWDVPKMEIGYWVRTAYAGQGYITEAVAAITEFAFITLNTNRLEIRCDSRNTRSAAVARRSGFKLEGTLRSEDRCPMTNELRDTLVFARIWQEVRPVAK